jgi:hypothetical protein
MGLTTGWMDQEVHGWLDWTGFWDMLGKWVRVGVCCGFAVHGVGAWWFGCIWISHNVLSVGWEMANGKWLVLGQGWSRSGVTAMASVL